MTASSRHTSASATRHLYFTLLFVRRVDMSRYCVAFWKVLKNRRGKDPKLGIFLFFRLVYRASRADASTRTLVGAATRRGKTKCGSSVDLLVETNEQSKNGMWRAWILCATSMLPRCHVVGVLRCARHVMVKARGRHAAPCPHRRCCPHRGTGGSDDHGEAFRVVRHRQRQRSDHGLRRDACARRGRRRRPPCHVHRDATTGTGGSHEQRTERGSRSSRRGGGGGEIRRAGGAEAPRG